MVQGVWDFVNCLFFPLLSVYFLLELISFRLD